MLHPYDSLLLGPDVGKKLEDEKLIMKQKRRGMHASISDASHLGPSSLRLGPRLKSLGKTWRKQ